MVAACRPQFQARAILYTLGSMPAASRPRTVASTAEREASTRLIHAECINCSLLKRSAYHFVENPPQTETSREALKLIAARITMGA